MKINIDNRARELYQLNCPHSYKKCESLEEVDYKIQRCVDLGKWNSRDHDLSFVEIQYHNKMLVVLNNRLVDMFTCDEPEYKIEEEMKEQHYNTYFKVMV